MEFTDRKLCSTCFFNHHLVHSVAPKDMIDRIACDHPKVRLVNKGKMMITPWPFGCILYKELEIK